MPPALYVGSRRLLVAKRAIRGPLLIQLNMSLSHQPPVFLFPPCRHLMVRRKELFQIFQIGFYVAATRPKNWKSLGLFKFLWELFGLFWELFELFGELFELFWELFGSCWELFGCSWELTGLFWELFGLLWELFA